ncbi:MAG TPA: hypothetical protein VFG09_15440 [Thermodesulfovibrionales bacterium]|jgi:hypothetical protein|nr:hypothetical protein [Thermodesulfovibrionales bacterium]
MGEVKSAFEKAMEKIQSIEGFSPEEREEFKDREKLRSLMGLFYKGELTTEEIGTEFKGMKPSLLVEAQHNMVDSIRSNSSLNELQQRKEGILALESLKARKNPSAIESVLKSIEKARREQTEMKERAIRELRQAVEQNPQLRLRPVRSADGRSVLQMPVSVDEAVQARLAEFLAEHEERYEAFFGQAIARLKKELR